jgi:acyl CoA:acetate/3-ketoacid CoA transferase
MGMNATVSENSISIDQEGSISKFVPEVSAISFSATNALKNNQEVLYVTERCLFRLEKDGLVLCEIANGIDLEKDILKQLPFPVKIADPLISMPFKLL